MTKHWTSTRLETPYEQRQLAMIEEAPRKNTLYLIRGAPGSGKSTFATQLISAGYADVSFEADSFRYKGGVYIFDWRDSPLCHKRCQEAVQEALEAGKNVAVANTFTRLWELEPYLKMPYGELKVLSLRYGYQNTHNVPTAVVERMRNTYEPYEGEKVYE